MRKTALFSVIFPGNLPFFSHFLKSLTDQSDLDFDVLLVVDSIPNLEEYLTPFRSKLTIFTLAASGTIAAVREKGIHWLENSRYDYVIFADSDDVMSPHRVEVCNRYLQDVPVVVNDVIPFTEASPQVDSTSGLWCGRLAQMETFSWSAIHHFNFTGLGNSAVQRKFIKSVRVPEELQVVDWFLFFHWLQTCEGIFVHDGCVNYRQHGQNLAGIKQVNDVRLQRIASVKITHYTNLLRSFPFVAQDLERHEKLAIRLKQDADYTKAMVAYLNTKQINYFWWEETEYLQ